MNILVGWDDAAEAELISLYLNTADNKAFVTACDKELLAQATPENQWDVILFAVVTGDEATSDELSEQKITEKTFANFQQLRQQLPLCPIVGACQSDDVFHLAKFMTAGMRTYVLRDFGGDFVFLLLTTLKSTLQGVRAEREQLIATQMRKEIESVRRFQEAAIPQNLAAPPGYNINGRYEPSQIRVIGGEPVSLAGGDYYDLFPINKNNMAIIIGDAAGHGMHACMAITILQTLLQTVPTKLFQKPHHLMETINRQFCEQKFVCLDGSLVTLLYGVLNFKRHQFQWTTAGHPVPLLQNCTDETVAPIGHNDIAGPPLGVDPRFRYTTTTTNLPQQSRLLFYTDGLTEASPNETLEQQFGIAGVSELLNRHRDQSGNFIVQKLMDDSQNFTQNAGRHDDTSVVLLERE